MAPRNASRPDPAPAGSLQPTGNGWQPNPGDELVGRMVGGGLSAPNQYGQYPIMTLQLADGTIRDVHCFHDVLKRRALELRPQFGEVVTVRYFGEQQHSQDAERTVHVYTLTVEGRGVDPWQAYDRRPQQAPQAAQGFPQQGFPQQGFPQQGFPQQGFPQQGFPQQGFPQQGFPQQGFSGPQPQAQIQNPDDPPPF